MKLIAFLTEIEAGLKQGFHSMYTLMKIMCFN